MAEVTFHLEVFDGPLDLLLHLLSKNKVEIKDIPIAEILDQYLDYIRKMQEFDMEIASEFITMAAQLMYIKSKMLLPVYDEDEENDPRAELVQSLLEYQRIKLAGTALNCRAEIGRDLFVKGQESLEASADPVCYQYSRDVLTRAMSSIWKRMQRSLPPPVQSFQGIVGHETVPVEEKIGTIVQLFVRRAKISFRDLVYSAKNRSEIVAIFLAVLELSRTHKIMIEDNGENDDCDLRLATREEQALSSAQTDND